VRQFPYMVFFCVNLTNYARTGEWKPSFMSLHGRIQKEKYFSPSLTTQTFLLLTEKKSKCNKYHSDIITEEQYLIFDW